MRRYFISTVSIVITISSLIALGMSAGASFAGPGI